MLQNRGTSVFVRSMIVPPTADVPPPLYPLSTFGQSSSSSDGKDPAEVVPALPTLDSSPSRTLRRRRRFSLPKRVPSSRSLRSRMIDGAVSIISFPKDSSIARPKTPERSQASSGVNPPASPTRSTASSQSGSRSRPLYSSIRKTLNNTNNVFSLAPMSLRSISPSERSLSGPGMVRPVSPLTLLSATDGAGSDESLTSGVSPYALGHVRSMSGCSLSGETELRMALSRRRRNTVSGCSEYTYQERAEKPGPSLMLTVRNIGKGFKSFVMSRA